MQQYGILTSDALVRQCGRNKTDEIIDKLNENFSN